MYCQKAFLIVNSSGKLSKTWIRKISEVDPAFYRSILVPEQKSIPRLLRIFSQNRIGGQTFAGSAEAELVYLPVMIVYHYPSKSEVGCAIHLAVGPTWYDTVAKIVASRPTRRNVNGVQKENQGSRRSLAEDPYGEDVLGYQG
jgi:hypothetical protein